MIEFLGFTQHSMTSSKIPLLIIVSGLPGTGKTTLALALAQDLGIAHFNTDMIREEIQKKGQYDPETKQVIYAELRRRVRQTLEAENSVIIDATFYQEAYRLPFLNEAKRLGVPIYWIELEADAALIRERVSKKRAYSEADFTVYQKIKKAYEPLTIPHLILSSGDKGVDKLITEVLAYISETDVVAHK